MQATQTIQVLVRARPTGNDASVEDDGEGSGIRVDPDSSTISFARERKGQTEFQFTKVFDQAGDQSTVYGMCNVVHDVISGINCCVMAYGQTGSGKTYTMYGSGWEEGTSQLDQSVKLSKSMELKLGDGIARAADADDASVGDAFEETSVFAGEEEGLGVIPRAISDLFRALEEKSSENPKFDYSISK